jgi:hypothetical protein
VVEWVTANNPFKEIGILLNKHDKIACHSTASSHPYQFPNVLHPQVFTTEFPHYTNDYLLEPRNLYPYIYITVGKSYAKC